MYKITQAPEKGKQPCLPHGLSVMNTYTEVTTGRRHVAIVIKNQTAVPIIISKGIKFAWVVTANSISLVEGMPGTREKLDKMQGIQWTKMSTEQRKEMLLQQLDLSWLEGWSGANCISAHALLTDYHKIFLLEPGELGCTSLAMHEVRVDEPFKEKFQRIPPPMVEEVRTHMKEMLELGAIHPSQSQWCNTIVLVKKKDKVLHFCIDFGKLNARTKKDYCPLPHIQKAIESLIGLVISLAWIWKQVYGRSPWTKHQNIMQPSQWGT